MPEIKNTFLAGRLNKDLDERLIGSGEYRDALNINVVSSESSDAGTVENLMGNQVIQTGTSALPPDAKTIGSIKDEATHKAYWFVTSPTYDGIYEFDQQLETISIIIRGDLNFSESNFITGVNIIDGLLFWTDDLNEPRKINIEEWKDANHRAVPSKIHSRNFVESDITVIKPHPKEKVYISTETDADKDKLPFEEIFPQFSYRWKYIDGEYSPFAFFTKPVFVPDEYKTDEHYKEGYNKAIKNIVTEITVSNIPRGTEDVVEVDVLYTESISSTVYTLKTIRKKDFGSDSDYLPPQTFIKRNFYSAIPNTQLSRHFDSVPLKAKAQEITANRLIYANYLQNFEQEKTASLRIAKVSKENENGLSVKGNRDYEVGVVYEDSFGRQGALITGDGSNYTTPFFNSGPIALKTKVVSEAPEWATHFKHYIKDSTNSHYNIPVYNTFNDGNNTKENSEFMWLQVPSSERNKVTEDTFLIPKRHTHGDLIAGDGSNQLGFNLKVADVVIPEMNVDGYWDERRRSRLAWVPGVENSIDHSHYESGRETTLTNPEMIFECTVPGDYTFSWEGELEFTSANIWSGDDVTLNSSFQVARNGAGFATLKHNIETEAEDQFVKVFHDNNANRDYRWYSSFTTTLEAGDRVRPTLGSARTDSSKNLRMKILEGLFSTQSTPVDPNADDIPVEQFNYPIRALSKHKVIELKSEAPDIVKTQLPVDLKIQGGAAKYNDDTESSKGSLFLTTGFNQGINTVANLSDYDESSDELIYEIDHNTKGLTVSTWLMVLNNTLEANNISKLMISVDPDEYDEPQAVDVSEIEGGLFFGVGAGSRDGASLNEMVKIKEITIGNAANQSPGGSVENRDVISFKLEEPIGVNPNNRPFAIHKGEITENAIKNLSGSFFVKIKRETGNKSVYKTTGRGITRRRRKVVDNLEQIPTGQSTFNNENEIQVLQTIWFETVPELDESNLNLFWEATHSIPISEHGEYHELDFANCIALSDGGVFIEAQKIYDKFNSPEMVKGIRVNVPQEDYGVERQKSGLIFSGIYNSRTGTNRLNEFIYSEGITKELEPNYGGIQKLHTRDTNLVALLEDKVFQIMADKDILFNADGNPQVVGSRNVLGQATPFGGEFGISKEANSFASYANRMYFVDSSRGSVIRLSTDGITQISEKGLSDFFRDKLKNNTNAIVGSYDSYNNQYVLTLDDYSITFSEKSGGWVSRVSYRPETAISVNNIFYTFKGGNIWQHNVPTVSRNNFYGTQYQSTLTTVFNTEPSTIKSFKTINYEGTSGWEVPLILTDQQSGYVIDFEAKEGKWYNNISGLDNINLVNKINTLSSTGGLNDAIDFYKEDNIKSKTFNSIQSKKVYKFADGDSSHNDHLGIGNLIGVTLADGTSTPSDITGQGTINFNLT